MTIVCLSYSKTGFDIVLVIFVYVIDIFMKRVQYVNNVIFTVFCVRRNYSYEILMYFIFNIAVFHVI